MNAQEATNLSVRSLKNEYEEIMGKITEACKKGHTAVSIEISKENPRVRETLNKMLISDGYKVKTFRTHVGLYFNTTIEWYLGENK